MSEPIILHNYVGGEFIAPSTGQYLDNPEPAVGTTLSHVPKSNAEDVKAAVDAAQAAFADWSARPYEYESCHGCSTPIAFIRLR